MSYNGNVCPTCPKGQVAYNQRMPDSSKPSSLPAFGCVWIVGIALSLISFRLAISGMLWNWGVPYWLITLTVLVGLWQWIWIAPMLRFAQHHNHHALYKGLLSGGVSFMATQLAICAVLYLLLRKFTLQ